MICECGQEIDESKISGPVRCVCRRWIYTQDWGRPNCCHRSEGKGEASCSCGTIYICNLLTAINGHVVYCGDRQPPEFANFGDVILDVENFRCCVGCEDRA